MTNFWNVEITWVEHTTAPLTYLFELVFFRGSLFFLTNVFELFYSLEAHFLLTNLSEFFSAKITTARLRRGGTTTHPTAPASRSSTSARRETEIVFWLDRIARPPASPAKTSASCRRSWGPARTRSNDGGTTSPRTPASLSISVTTHF
jgi:hypothetical protein